jgi:hypothetical protein
MTDQIQTSFSTTDLPTVPPEVKVKKSRKPYAARVPGTGVTARRRVKVVDLLKHVKEKRAAKLAQKHASKPAGKLNSKALKVAKHTAAVKAILNAKAQGQTVTSKTLNVSACSVCGKPLTDPQSISQGMGDYCAHMGKLLPKGVSRSQHIESLTVTSLPDNSIKLKDGYAAARKAGYSGSSFLQATGGNGGIRKPLNSHFKVTFYKGTRYVPATCLQHLSDLTPK